MTRKKDWTDEEIADVKATRAAGQSFYEIGRRHGISHRKVRELYREIMPDAGRGPTVDQTKLRAMWDGLASYREISTAFGVTDDVVNGWRRKFNLPPRLGKPPVVNLRERRFTDAEKATFQRLGYSVGPNGLAAALPGRSAISCEMHRRRMANAGLIVRPTEHLRRSRDSRSVTAKPAAAPPPKPVRAAAPPLPPEPVARVLPPGTEVLIRRPWPVIKQMAMADLVVLTEFHDLDRYNKRRSRLGKPPVYIAMGGAAEA